MEQFFFWKQFERDILFHMMQLHRFTAAAAREASLALRLLYSVRGRKVFSAISSLWYTLKLQSYTVKRYAATNICSDLKDQISVLQRLCF